MLTFARIIGEFFHKFSDRCVLVRYEDLGGGLGRFQPEQQPHPRDRLDPFGVGEGFAEEVALALDAGEQFVVDPREDGKGGGAGCADRGGLEFFLDKRGRGCYDNKASKCASGGIGRLARFRF